MEKGASGDSDGDEGVFSGSGEEFSDLVTNHDVLIVIQSCWLLWYERF